jgi:homoserine dehydrogenase
VKVAIVGFGTVGKGVARMIASKDLGISVTGIADSQSGCMDASGLSLKTVLSIKELL